MHFTIRHAYMSVYSIVWVDEQPTNVNGHAIMCMQFPRFSFSGNDTNIYLEHMYNHWMHVFSHQKRLFHHLSDGSVEIAGTWWHGHLRSVAHPCLSHSDDEINVYVGSRNAFNGHKICSVELNKQRKEKNAFKNCNKYCQKNAWA